ncbi:M23 family metallopeptidase [Cellulomonas massiliensis]|uniref:M23 family metallopeptidase n=1 Tax=Cellulomonas massiliensis TaxID=1465811 RepID=UPI000314359B|nr:M23 family metallopeptidase [Cellulomonas massiliensis]
MPLSRPWRAAASLAVSSLVVAGLVLPAEASTASPSPTPSPTSSATATPKPTPTPTATATPKPTPTPTATPKPTIPSKLTKATAPDGQTLVIPVATKEYALVSGYGPRCIPTVGGSTFHLGLDMSAPDGYGVYAVAAGTVSHVVQPRGGASGYLVVRSYVDGKTTYLAYIHPWNPGKYVKVGQKVAAGQRIADVGASGPASGPHLHLEVWTGAFYGVGRSTDPAAWLRAHNLDVVKASTGDRRAKAPTKCVYYSSATLNVRAAATTASKVVKVVAANTTLANKPGTMVNKFVPVTVTTSTGKTYSGWVHSTYIRQYKTYSIGATTAVRVAATSKARSVATVAKGRALTRVATSGTWTKVRVSGVTGWVPSKNVRAGL